MSSAITFPPCPRLESLVTVGGVGGEDEIELPGRRDLDDVEHRPASKRVARDIGVDAFLARGGVDRVAHVRAVDRDHLDGAGDLDEDVRAGRGRLPGCGGRVRYEIREVDVAFRQGGEECVVLLPETDARGATVLAQRLGAAVRDEPIVITPIAPTMNCPAGQPRMPPVCSSGLPESAPEPIRIETAVMQRIT